MAGVEAEVTDEARVTTTSRIWTSERARSAARREDAARADGGGATIAGQQHDQKAGPEERAIIESSGPGACE